MARLTRFQPSGMAGRVARLTATTLLLAPAAIILAVFDSPVPVAVRVLCCIVSLLIIWAWARLPWVGIWNVSDGKIAWRSWFSPLRTIELSSVERFRATEYLGLFFVVGWTIPDGRWQSGQVSVELKSGENITLRGSVTSLLAANAQCRELNDRLGIERPRTSYRENGETG